MPGRQFVGATGYSYGFGGQLKDDEISGNGNSYTAEFWQYDPRLGRRWNRDPVIEIGISDYACFGNNSILYSDPYGDFKTRLGASLYAFFTGGTAVKDQNTGEWGVAKVTKGNDGVYEFNMRYDWTTDRSKPYTEEQKNQIDDYLDNYKNQNNSNWDPTLTVEQAKKNFINLNLSVVLPNFIKPGTALASKVEETTVKQITELSPYELEITHGITKSKNAFLKLKADIQANGIKESIKFVEHNGKKFVVDGHHRLRAAKELGLKNVPVEKVDLPYLGYKNVDDLIFTH